MAAELSFEELVNLYYSPLYRFALSLTHSESDAGDLTQQTFYVWAVKGSQLLDRSKAKTWLFTTLHREFLQRQRRNRRFPECELTEALNDLPSVAPTVDQRLDGATILQCLAEVDLLYQGPVALFYLEDFSYPEIAGILNVPLGTVKSRISRGISQLQRVVAERRGEREAKRG